MAPSFDELTRLKSRHQISALAFPVFRVITHMEYQHHQLRVLPPGLSANLDSASWPPIGSNTPSRAPTDRSVYFTIRDFRAEDVAKHLASMAHFSKSSRNDGAWSWWLAWKMDKFKSTIIMGESPEKTTALLRRKSITYAGRNASGCKIFYSVPSGRLLFRNTMLTSRPRRKSFGPGAWLTGDSNSM